VCTCDLQKHSHLIKINIRPFHELRNEKKKNKETSGKEERLPPSHESREMSLSHLPDRMSDSHTVLDLLTNILALESEENMFFKLGIQFTPHFLVVKWQVFQFASILKGRGKYPSQMFFCWDGEPQFILPSEAW
jgi:hypothetical protein